MLDALVLQLATGTIIGLGAGYLGSFMILRRMSLVGDALSHVALPGIAVALLIHINPFIGAFAALIIAVIGIWSVEQQSSLPSETLVGIAFTTALALGLLLTPEPELLEALFGNITKIGLPDFILAVLLVLVVLFVMGRITKGMLLGIISSDLAKSTGIALDTINLIFLLLVSVIVALGLKVAGTLLMGSLVIIPAAAAKNISQNLHHYTFLGGLFGALSALIGIFIASYWHLNPGAIVVLTSGVIFLGTLLFKK